MSHVAQQKVLVKSLDDLGAAVKRLGGTLKRGETKVRWYSSGFVDDSTTWKDFFSKEEADRIAKLSRTERVKIINAEMSRADHVISFPGAHYDVGVMRMQDSTFRLRWDQYAGGGGLHKFIGHDGGLLGQAYAIEAAKRAARRKGFIIREEKQPNGHIKLKLMMQ